MTINQYLKKCRDICNHFEEKGECGKICPLFEYACGMPEKSKLIKTCIETVEKFEIPQAVRDDNPIQQVVFCKDCGYYCTNDGECNLHGAHLGEYGFCSKGRAN